MNKNIIVLGFILVVSFVVTGCQTAGSGGKTYTRGQAQQSMQVFSGTVLAVSDVTIEGQSGGLATAAGGVIGYQAGKNSGGNSSKGLRRSIGATVGANAGAAVSKRASSQAGLEIEVEMDDGRIQVIVQKKDDDFRVGDRVRVVQAGDGTLRIRQ